jgi:serine/threonine protein kinase
VAGPELLAPVLPGETLAGKYRVERILGKGGMGIVVAAKHLELDERVAIKFLLRAGPESIERFIREARAAAKVKGEHVCRVFDVARLESGEPYIVMEYLEGVDLAERLAKERTLPLPLVASWIIQACTALSEAHALGIVHRDLKPANVFLAARADGGTCVKILDFGISKLASNDAMTSTTALIGSPAYMSPEQLVSARTVDHRADIWSLGVMLHELVTGSMPFTAESVIQLTVTIRESTPSAPSALVTELPSSFDLVVAKCLAKAPESRFANVRELAMALAPFAEQPFQQLAQRIGRVEPESDPALVATAHDTNPSRATPEAPAATSAAPERPAEGVGQVTLEPITSASGTRPSSGRRWLPFAGLALVGLGVAFGISRRTPTVTATTTDAAPSTSANVIESASPPVVSPSREVVAEPAPPPVKTTAPSPTVPSTPRPASTAKPSAEPYTAPSLAPVPEPPVTAAPSAAVDAGARRPRSLDRSDPYAH